MKKNVKKVLTRTTACAAGVWQVPHMANTLAIRYPRRRTPKIRNTSPPPVPAAPPPFGSRSANVILTCRGCRRVASWVMAPNDAGQAGSIASIATTGCGAAWQRACFGSRRSGVQIPASRPDATCVGADPRTPSRPHLGKNAAVTAGRGGPSRSSGGHRPADAGLGAVPHDPGQLGHERLHRHGGQGRRHDGDRHPARHHALHVGHGGVHDHRAARSVRSSGASAPS